jgi:hypothetical protein
MIPASILRLKLSLIAPIAKIKQIGGQIERPAFKIYDNSRPPVTYRLSKPFQ